MTRKFSAGGAVYKIEEGRTLWLVTKPRPNEAFRRDRYVLPKGEVEPGEQAEATAVREVMEETGVTATVEKKIDFGKSFYEVDGEKIFKITTYFLMTYQAGETTINAEVEELLWLPFEEAKKTLSYSNEKKILQKAQELIQLESQGKLL